MSEQSESDEYIRLDPQSIPIEQKQANLKKVIQMQLAQIRQKLELQKSLKIDLSQRRIQTDGLKQILRKIAQINIDLNQQDKIFIKELNLCIFQLKQRKKLYQHLRFPLAPNIASLSSKAIFINQKLPQKKLQKIQLGCEQKDKQDKDQNKDNQDQFTEELDQDQGKWGNSLIQLVVEETNQLSVLPLAVSRFINLKILHLADNQIVSIEGLRCIDPHNKLQQLHLQQNSISNCKVLSHLNLKNLQALFLNFNKILQLGTGDIRRMKLPSLTYFHLYNNRLNGEYYKQLVVSLKENKLIYAVFQNQSCAKYGKFASTQWIKQNIGWRRSPF